MCRQSRPIPAPGVRRAAERSEADLRAPVDADLDNLTNIDHNTWDSGVTVNEADFRSLDSTGADAPRSSGGCLPDLPFLHLAEGSDLIDSGVDVGLPYVGEAPDLGGIEYH